MTTIEKEYTTQSGVKIEIAETRGFEVEQERVWLDGHVFYNEVKKEIHKSMIFLTLPDGTRHPAKIHNREESEIKYMPNLSEDLKHSWYFSINNRKPVFFRSADDRESIIKMLDDAKDEAETDEDWKNYIERKAKIEKEEEELYKKRRAYEDWVNKIEGE